LRTALCSEDAWRHRCVKDGGLGLRSVWRLYVRGTAEEFVRLRCVAVFCHPVSVKFTNLG